MLYIFILFYIIMKKFREIKKTGDGTFGVVIKAEDT